MLDKVKHLLHILALCLAITLVEYGTIKKFADFDIAQRIQPQSGAPSKQNNLQNYYDLFIHLSLLLFKLIKYLTVLNLPQVLSNFLGLTLFNAFPGEIRVANRGDSSPIDTLKLPHICLRVVTRGLYPELVQRNVNKNYQSCLDAGLCNFSIEVVTDKDINLNCFDQTRIRQTVVPQTYQTLTGAMFKARALQYALEPEVSCLQHSDYIVHLDEETLVSRNSINGIVNFVLDGRHSFGQGLITYLNQEVVNWPTTLADSLRVGDDLGKLRFQFRVFHKPLFGWKGSYVVTKCGAEKDVSFDHGPDGSIAEDCYFSMIAFSKGYTFDFIQGEMYEKSPFTLIDFVRQRRRWIQGIWLVVHSPEIPIIYKITLAVTFYGWVVLPLTATSFIASLIFHIPTSSIWVDLIGSFCFSVTYYMYIFGLIKSLGFRANTKIYMLPVYVIFQILSIFLSVILECIAVVWAVFSPKHNFYIVAKDVNLRSIDSEV